LARAVHDPARAPAARACALSRSQFDRLFVDIMGLPFGRFELRRRVHGAARRLLSSDAPLKAVAADWGFSSASHLTRRFADFYGCSPGEYRKHRM
jgi:AraC family transcriptional regulator